MFKLEDVLQLKDNEDVKLLVQRHPITLAPGLGGALLLIVIPFFFMFPLFSWGVIGLLLFMLAVAAGIVIAIRTVLLWNADVLIVTTLRLVDVDQRGLLARFVTETPLTSIQDVAWHRRGFVDTVFKVGTLKVLTTGTSPDIEVKRVAHPELVHELINDLRHATSPKRTDIPPERREHLRKLVAKLEELNDEALERVEQSIKNEDREEATFKFLKKDVPSSS